MKRIILSIAVIVMTSSAQWKTDSAFEMWDQIQSDTTVYEMDDSETLCNVLANFGFSLTQQEIICNVLEEYEDVLIEKDVIAVLEAFNGNVNKTVKFFMDYKGEETDWAW